MWIRSQDKASIVECDKIQANGYGWAYANEVFVGNYLTEERSIQVLNEIESHINNKYTSVYQMPKE